MRTSRTSGSWRRAAALAGLTGAAMLGLSCSRKDKVTGPPAVSRVEVNPPSVSLLVGETGQLQATVLDADGNRLNLPVTWRSGAPGTVSVSGNGVLTAVAAGQGVIVSATAGGVTGEATVSVHERPKFTVFVGVAPGVSGLPPSGTMEVDSGYVLAYGYTPATGFENLQVSVDSEPAAQSGSITVTKDVALSASADAQLVVPTGDQTAVDQVTALLTATDPLPAYRQLRTTIQTVVATTPPAQLRERLAAIEVAALRPSDDAANMRRALDIVGDSLFLAAVARPVATTRLRGTRANSRAAASAVTSAATPTVFMYVNGINTSAVQEESTVDLFLEPMISAAGYHDRTRYPVEWFYNRSAKWLGESGREWTCLNLFAEEFILGMWAGSDEMLRCFGPPGAAFDLAQSTAQMLNGVMGSLPVLAEPDAISLGDRIARTVRSGSRVILIAHSQGSLMAGEALEAIRRTPQGVDLRCVGVLSIAPPREISVSPQGPSASAMIIRDRNANDILATFHLGMSASMVTNSRSAYWMNGDPWLSDASKALTPSLFVWHGIAAGIDLHSIDWSYLGSSGTREAVMSAIQAQAQAVEANCPDPQPSGSLTIGVSIGGSGAPAGPFQVVVDPGSAQAVTQSVAANDTATIEALPAGMHTVTISGTGIGSGTSCPVLGGESKQVDLVAGAVSRIDFVVACAGAPGASTSSASGVTTTSFQVNGLVTPNGSPTTSWFEYGTSSALVTFASTAARQQGSGTTAVAVAETITGATPGTTYYFRVVAANAGGTIRGTILSTTTAALPGSIVVSNAVTGATQALGPFTVTMDPQGAAPVSQTLPRDAAITFANVDPGVHELQLTGAGIGSGTACPIVGGASQSISVAAGATAAVAYQIACVAPDGFIHVSTPVIGPNQPSGPFTVTLDAASPHPVVQSIAPNGSAVFANVPAGVHELRLTGAGIGSGTSCPITGGFIQNPTVQPGAITTAVYQIVCAGLVGDLVVVNTMTGPSQPAGGAYQATIDATGPNPISLALRKNGSVTFVGLSAGVHDLRLTGPDIGVGTNCPIVGGYIQTPNVLPGTTTTATYQIVCIAIQAPTTTTLAATSVTQTSFQLNGDVNPNFGSTDAWYEYGTDPLLSQYSVTTPRSVGSGNIPISFSELFTGVLPGVTYYYRLAASNPAGTSRGQILSVTTLSGTSGR